MKCVKTGDKIERVSDLKAEAMVATGKSVYVPKKEWKEKRDSK